MTEDYEESETGESNTNHDDSDDPPTVVKKHKKKKKKNRKTESNKRMLDGDNTEESDGKYRKIYFPIIAS
jgi:hypothetical protein